MITKYTPPASSSGAESHKVCLRCNRRLKNEEAMRVGYGKVCLRKIQESQNTQERLF